MTKFKIHYFKILDSTNKTAKSFPTNSIIVAQSQKKGKGRFTREWSSQTGGIYVSIVLKPKTNLVQHYTFIAALAAFKAVCKLNSTVKIKWPNDLIISKKKVCGILTQNVIKKNRIKTIIGIGINTNNTLPKSLDKIATSLKKESGKKIDNTLVLKSLIKNIEKYLKIYDKSGFNKIKQEWLKNSLLINQKVKIKTIHKTITGIATGVDNECKLLLRKNNKIIKISEGDLFYSP